MKHTSETSFWGGKNEAALRELDAEVPFMGEVQDKARPMLEEWRKLSGAYYRHYNDGDSFATKLRFMAERFNVKPFRGWSDEDLELLADAVFTAAVTEQQQVLRRRK